MTLRTLSSCTIATLILGGVWSVASSGGPRVLRADPPTVDLDSDGDFLPDVIEWACLTSAQACDTDLDGTEDFIEVVQRGNPRQPGLPLPHDHEMRVVVTSNPGPAGNEIYLHLLFRFMGSASLLTSLDAWAEVAAAPGLQIPLASVVAHPVTVHERFVPNEGLWVRATVPLVSEQVLRWVLPCTIGADAVIGSRSIRNKVPLFDRSGTTSSLVPFSDSLFAVQSIGSLGSLEGSGSNQVCVLQLRPLGGGAYEITGAECQDCNDLVCGVDCASSVGTIIILPGGSGSITGG
jgi:hypothetical protein